jgi:hypothetical protein
LSGVGSGVVFRVRGVRIWIGDALEGAADEAWSGHPLREITELCGLALGGDDTPDDGPVRFNRRRQKRQPVQRIRLATVEGQLVQFDDRPIDSIGGAQGFDEKGRGAL